MGKIALEWLPLSTPYAGEDVVCDDVRVGPVNPEYDDDLEDARGVYACATCRCHLVKASALVSKEFKGKSGKAYLFDGVANFVSGPREDRQLITGKHTIADIACVNCSQVLGWQYIHAFKCVRAAGLGVAASARD